MFQMSPYCIVKYCLMEGPDVLSTRFPYLEIIITDILFYFIIYFILLILRTMYIYCYSNKARSKWCI